MGWFAIYPCASQFQGVLQDSRFTLLLNLKVKNQKYTFLFPETCISGPENEGNAYGWNQFLNFQVFFTYALYENEGKSCFWNHLIIVLNLRWWIFIQLFTSCSSFKKSGFPNFRSFVLVAFIKTLQQLYREGQYSHWGSGSFHAKNYLSGFCCQQLKPRSNLCHWK